MQQTLAPALPPISPEETAPRLRLSSIPREFPGPPPARPHQEPRWQLARLAGSLVEISGTADSGVLSSALTLVAEAQHNQARRHKHRSSQNRRARSLKTSSSSNQALVAWIATTRSLFFPPDAMESGISLDRLILLRLETPGAQIRAATRIVHSGAFELVIVDLADSVPALDWNSGSGWNAGPDSVAASRYSRSLRSQPSRPNTSPGVPPLSRLAGLAHKYRAAVVLLTDKPPAAPSLDPRVGKRFDASRGENGIVITVLKDKGGGGICPPEEPGRNRLTPGFRFERECCEPAGMC